MASAPSASALSAVLRCRGNIWSRNPPAKRPGPAKLRGDSAERRGPNRGPDRGPDRLWARGGEVCRKTAGLSDSARTGAVRRLLRVLTQSRPAAGQNFTQIPPGVLKLTVTSRSLPEIPCLGSKLKVTCCPLTSSRFGLMLVRMFWSSSCRRSGGPQRHLLEQAAGRTAASTEDRAASGAEVTRDRPD